MIQDEKADDSTEKKSTEKSEKDKTEKTDAEKDEEKEKEEKKKEPEPNFEMLNNPARTMRAQVQYRYLFFQKLGIYSHFLYGATLIIHRVTSDKLQQVCHLKVVELFKREELTI